MQYAGKSFLRVASGSVCFTADLPDVEPPVAVPVDIDEQDRKEFGFTIGPYLILNMGLALTISIGIIAAYVKLSLLVMTGKMDQMSSPFEILMIASGIYGLLVFGRLLEFHERANNDAETRARRVAALMSHPDNEVLRKDVIDKKRGDYRRVAVGCWRMAMKDLREMA